MNELMKDTLKILDKHITLSEIQYIEFIHSTMVNILNLAVEKGSKVEIGIDGDINRGVLDYAFAEKIDDSEALEIRFKIQLDEPKYFNDLNPPYKYTEIGETIIMRNDIKLDNALIGEDHLGLVVSYGKMSRLKLTVKVFI